MEENGSAELVAQARARGAYPHVAEVGQNPDKGSTMDGIAEALSFPSWTGRNLDALYDSLTDLSWLPAGEHVLVWVGSATLKATEPKVYLAIHSVLSDAVRALATGGERADSRKLTVVLSES